jgi:hypothetical protein
MVFPPLFVGTLREHYLLLFGAAGAIATAAGFVGAWLGAKMAAHSAARTVVSELDIRRAGGREMEELRLLSQSVEAVAIEVERVAEAQRFVAKLLSERAESRLPGPSSLREIGQNTPH